MRVRLYTLVHSSDAIVSALTRGVIVLIGAALAACGGPGPLVPVVSTRSLRFHQDSGYVLVDHINTCTSSGLPYCFEWRHVTADYVGTVSSTAIGAATITLEGMEYRAANFHTDSLPNLFRPRSGFCGAVTMRARFADNALVGTMEHQTDCHGLTRAGSFRADGP
jgi:hypothetical protein